MKSIERLLYLLIGTLLFNGCIFQDPEDCEGTICFEFRYKNNQELFDQVIASDIYFHLYHEEIVKTMLVLPFDIIKGGRTYGIRKEQTGEMEVIAWAVPATETISGEIPQAANGSRKEEAKIEIQPIQGGLYKPLDFLHRGSARWTETELTGNTGITVSLTPAVSRLRVILYDEGTYTPENSPGIEVAGLQKELTIDLEPTGADIVIDGSLHLAYEENQWHTGWICLPPSAAGKTLSVKVIPAGQTGFTVYTTYESVAGDDIVLEIKGKLVRFFVNGWRKENITVEGL
ncbi:MAG: FimB/Mfa2 family fimbrial subunit [Tannerellaceae bacterium]|nr:FimB/Mfa2 family fimbrial subunit [Tannerellaceae bacterium]